MITRLSIGIGSEHAHEMRNFACLRPPGSFVVGWVDFEPDKDRNALDHRKYAVILLRSGRFMASRGENIRAIPEYMFSYIRLNCGSKRP